MSDPRTEPIRAPLRAVAAVNAKLFLTKALVWVTCLCPFRRWFLDMTGSFLLLPLLIRERRELHRVRAFSRQIGVPGPNALYMLRHFIQKGRDLVWAAVYPEIPDLLGRYVTLEGADELAALAASRAGAIVLGVHCGPNSAALLLERRGVPLRWLISPEAMETVACKVRWGARWLVTRKALFFADPSRSALSSRGERQLVEQLRNGGTILMLADAAAPPPHGTEVRFLGTGYRISLFPFRAAIKYRVPIFYLACEKPDRGGYRYTLTRAGTATTPEDAAQACMEYFDAVIRRQPYLCRMPANYVPWA